MSRCGCCCKEYGKYQECLCEYGGYSYGQRFGVRSGGNFSSLIILILILLYFGNIGQKEREREKKFGGMEGIIFIITLYYLVCGCGFGGLGRAY